MNTTPTQSIQPDHRPRIHVPAQLPTLTPTPERLAAIREKLQSDYIYRQSRRNSRQAAFDNDRPDWNQLAEQVNELGGDVSTFLDSQATGEDRDGRRILPPASQMIGPEAVAKYWNYYYNGPCGGYASDPRGQVWIHEYYLNLARNRAKHPDCHTFSSSAALQLYAWFRVLWCPEDLPEYPEIFRRYRNAAIYQLKANPRLFQFLRQHHPERLIRLF